MDSNRYFPTLTEDQKVPILKAGPQTNLWLSIAQELLGRCEHYSRSDYLGSLYVGSLGPLVYLKWRMALLMENSSKKQEILLQALAIAKQQLDMYEPREGQNPFRNTSSHRSQRVSLLEGSYVGCKALCAVLQFELKMTELSHKTAQDLIATLRQACLQLPKGECEVLYGRAGALQTILFLRKGLGNPDLGSREAVSLAKSILVQGQEEAASFRRGSNKKSFSLLWTWHQKPYLGAAHGVVGILQMILALQPSELQDLEKQGGYLSLIRATINELDMFCFPSGNLDSSIHERPASDRLVHWCHGATGHVILLVKAYQVFGEGDYFNQARRIASDVIWTRGLLRKGVGLCYGISGSAYAFLAVGRLDPTFQEKARVFAQFAIDHLGDLELVPDHPYSLFEGLGGLCSLVMDLADPGNALFPLYECG
jgi:hypothetical protein